MLVLSLPLDLTEARLQLHYAIQLIAATGAALATPQPDYSHSSIDWNADLHLFVGATISADQPFQVALDPVNLIVLLLNERKETLAHYGLHQRTLADGLEWLKHQIAELGGDEAKVELLSYPPDDFPDHAIAHGAPFHQHHQEARQVLVDYYSTTHLLLQDIVASTAGASPIHIWPHHFDMATLISRPEYSSHESKSIGVRLSPGDSSYSEPYWYVSPYPYPDPDTLPELQEHGFWHTTHWTGAVLTASQLKRNNQQLEQVSNFLKNALITSKNY
jgi:hypothetical protein